MFVHVLKLCVEAGLVSGKLLITDSTHVKANATKMSKVVVEIERETAAFFERLDAYEAEERKRLELPEVARKTPEPKTVKQTQSATDPEAGWLRRPGKPEGFHYLLHQTLDADNGIIVDVLATAGNTSDNTPYIGQIDAAIESLDGMDITVEGVCADSGYDNALIHKELQDRNLTPTMPKKKTSDSSKTE